MIYILDAYNVIHKIPSLEKRLDQDLRSARDGLVSLCSGLLSRRADISEIIAVFDGKPNFRDLPRKAPPKIRIIFSETPESADEIIVQILEGLSHVKEKCVVSDDNFVRNHAKAYAAGTLSVAEFERLSGKAASKSNLRAARQNTLTKLTPEQADEITRAYKKNLDEKRKL